MREIELQRYGRNKNTTIDNTYINSGRYRRIVCHDGKIYMYSADEEISEDYYNLTVAEYLQHGYNEYDAQINALKEIEGKFNIRFTEVMDNDA